MEHIDCVYYINLEHRVDRKELFLDEMKRFDISESKLHRIEATYTKGFGALGCAHSHIRALEHFILSPYKTCIIFEDDFQFTIEKDYFHQMLSEIFTKEINFDVILLAGNILEEKMSEYPFLKRVTEAQTTSGYLITKSFAKILLKNFQEAAILLHEYYSVHETRVETFCIDRHWKHLQKKYKWYCLFPKVGLQREGFSDIEEKFTKYGV
jgi:GR25 family glycosyltransferase involved in LPS biosynthesis